MISFEQKGDFRNTEGFLARMKRLDLFRNLSKFGAAGVSALSAATPVDTGLAASSWSYKVETSRSSSSIAWYNSNKEGGVSVVILLQYGHGTGTGGYVRGRDFINPAIQPIFDKIADDVWREVIK
jgi:hypothetical protein